MEIFCFFSTLVCMMTVIHSYNLFSSLSLSVLLCNNPYLFNLKNFHLGEWSMSFITVTQPCWVLHIYATELPKFLQNSHYF